MHAMLNIMIFEKIFITITAMHIEWLYRCYYKIC